MLKDISGITEEELDTISKKVALTKNDEVVLLPDDWVEQDGIRYLKVPIKVHRIPWSHYNFECSSITSEVYNPEFLYVYAFSITEESKMLLSKVFQENSLRKKGYCYYYGLQREELSTID